LGAGIYYHHLIALDERKTTPWTDLDYYDSSKSSPEDRFASWIDTATKERVVYTFRGIKLEGRMTLNPQAFFKSKFLSKDDLKLYGEVAVLGLQSYPGGMGIFGNAFRLCSDSTSPHISLLPSRRFRRFWGAY
jgi:hypothetical protein